MNPHLLTWVWSPLAAIVAAATAIAYFWRYGWTSRAWWMLAALATFIFTLTSPLAALANGYLFSAHMLQHILLVLAVPAFALMALPSTFRLPPRIERLLNPAVCWACGVGAMWIWHAPALCNAAASSRAVFAVQTLSLLALGGAYWWQLLAPCADRRIPPLHGVMYLFAACIACSILGIILTFSPVSICRAYLNPANRLALGGAWDIQRDQQIGGLIMWVPMCMVYLGAIFGQLARWYTEPAPRHATIS